MPRSVSVSSGYEKMPNVNPRIENQLVNIRFAGWESNTYTLQQQGWQISVNEDPNSMHLQIALKHPAWHMYGLTQKVDYHRMREMGEMQRHSGICLEVVRMETRMSIDASEAMIMQRFSPVDARPSVVFKERVDIDDFRIFRPLPQHNQIIVPEQNVDELLAKIHELQDPEQERIREDKRNRMRRELHKCNQDANNYDISTNIVAQVATFT